MSSICLRTGRIRCKPRSAGRRVMTISLLETPDCRAARELVHPVPCALGKAGRCWGLRTSKLVLMDGRAILAEPTKEFRLRPKILMHISGSKRNPILKRLAKRARASIVQRHRRPIEIGRASCRERVGQYV